MAIYPVVCFGRRVATQCVATQCIAVSPYRRIAVSPYRPSSSPREITERPRAPSGVAAVMSAHNKTSYITPSMDFFLWDWGSTGARGAATWIYLGRVDCDIVGLVHICQTIK